MNGIVRFMVRGIIALLCFSLAAALSTSAVAQTTARKIPTAPQVAMQKKAKSKKGVMRGTTQYDRWQAATKHADRRAAHTRAAQKGVK
jgi:hypothetical protein